MPSDRRYIPYRPDSVEEELLSKLSKMKGLSMSRLLGQALREMAAREGVVASEQADNTTREKTEKKDS
jgi:hypothetical protein